MGMDTLADSGGPSHEFVKLHANFGGGGGGHGDIFSDRFPGMPLCVEVGDVHA